MSMVLLLGILAFAVDSSFLYTERNRMAAAADAAAKSAAIELKRRPGISTADLTTFAQHEVVAQGFAASNVVAVNHPPDGTSAFSGNSGMVQVKVSRPTNTFFASVVNAAWSSVSPLAVAVAGAAAPGNCLIVNGNMDVKNNTELDGCGLAVGGNLTTQSKIQGTPPPLSSVSGTYNGPSDPNVAQNQPKPADPLNGLVAPTVTGTGCSSGGIAGTTSPLPSGCYSSISNAVTQLATGGTFKLSGTWDLNGNATATNVLLYLTSGGSIQTKNNDSLTITAQTTGTYQGIAIYGDAGSGLDAKNSFTLNVDGMVYMPGTDLDVKNNISIVPATANGCLMVVLGSYTAKNNGGVTGTVGTGTTSCYSRYGGATFLGVALSE